jgi:hypothetical protein
MDAGCQVVGHAENDYADTGCNSFDLQNALGGKLAIHRLYVCRFHPFHFLQSALGGWTGASGPKSFFSEHAHLFSEL